MFKAHTLLNLLKTAIALTIIPLAVYLCIYVFQTEVYGGIIHFPSMLLVIGVVIGIAFLMVEWKDIGRFLSLAFSYSVSKHLKDSDASEKAFEQLVETYQRQSSSDLTEDIKNLELPRVWQIVATKLKIKVPISDIKVILDYQVQKISARLDQDIHILRQMGVIAPAIGMFGSVLGLIRLLANMTDFSSLGANMSLALITTLYGIFIGNIIFSPLIRKVEKRKYLTIKNHENLMYWLEHLEANKPSFYLKSRISDLYELGQESRPS